MEPGHLIKLHMVLVCTNRKELVYLKLVINVKKLTWNIPIGNCRMGEGAGVMILEVSKSGILPLG